MSRGAAAVTVLISAGCAPKPAVAPNHAAGPSPAERLAAADEQVRAGCFDCLLVAFRECSALRSIASVADLASIGAARSATLVAIRERELGTEDSGYLTRAREIAASVPSVQQALGVRLEIADALPTRGSARLASDDVELSRNQAAYRNRVAWTDELRAGADRDALSAYLWRAFNCAHVSTGQQAVGEWTAAVPTWSDTSLLTLKAATCGGSVQRTALEKLVETDPRFVEVHYFLASSLAFTGQIDAAMDHLLQAYAWRSRWPAVTNSLGVDYITLEDFDRAIVFFDRTLAVVPDLFQPLARRRGPSVRREGGG